MGNNPLALAFDPANGDVYVANENVSGDHGSVTVISGSTDAVLTTLVVGARPSLLAVDADNGDVYVLNSFSGNASIINGSTNTVTGSISLPCGGVLGALGSDSIDRKVYVGCAVGEGALYIIADQTNSVVAKLLGSSFTPVGWSLAVDTDDSNVYSVGNASTTDAISEVDGASNTVVGATHIGEASNDLGLLTFDPANADVYALTDPSPGKIAVLSTASFQVTTTVPAGAGAIAVAYDSGNGNLYVANYASNNVTVISGSTNRAVASVPVGLDPRSLFVDPTTGNVYVVNTGSDNVSVVSGTTNRVVATLPAGLNPESIVIDTSSGTVFVGNNGSSNVSVIAVPVVHHTSSPAGLLAIPELSTEVLLLGTVTGVATGLALGRAARVRQN